MPNSDIQQLLYSCGIVVDSVTLYREQRGVTAYLVNGTLLLKTSASALAEIEKLNRVQALPLVPGIHASGSVALAGVQHAYVLMDYVQGGDLWSAARSLNEQQQRHLGSQVALFRNALHAITDDAYDIGHYVPTIPRCAASWEEGHRQYAAMLKRQLAEVDLNALSQTAVADAFAYIDENIHALAYQAGARLLHNDFHPKNIIVREGRLAGIIDWECSQYGEADFELSHLIHWCIYPPDEGHPTEAFVKSVIKNAQAAARIPELEKRLTIYQLEHELNQILWHGKGEADKRMCRIDGWLHGRVSALLKP